MGQQDYEEKVIQSLDFDDALDGEDMNQSDVYKDQTWLHKSKMKARPI